MSLGLVLENPRPKNIFRAIKRIFVGDQSFHLASACSLHDRSTFYGPSG